MNYFNFIAAHIVPYGTPGALLVFMVLIERVRNLIRPLTLAVRLGANIIAGHLLLSLVGGAVRGVVFGSAVYFVLLLLIVLEMAVAVIQGYVFVTLMVLYFSEVEYGEM